MSLHAPMLCQLRSLLLSSGLLLGVFLASGQAQVTTTITPDGTLGTTVTQSGTIHNITGGTRPGNGPKLIVVLVLDQFRADYIDLYGRQWTKGLRRLVDRFGFLRS